MKYTFLKFKKGEQKKLICRAITKAGSERKLSKILSIPKGSIYHYKFELSNLPIARTRDIINFLNMDFDKFKEENIVKILSENWGRTKGGINCIRNKQANGSFHETVERLKKSSSNRMRLWHKNMKKNNPEEYYNLQYERFKKINGGYVCKLKNKIHVRNKLEKKVGDYLISEDIRFEYEPYTNINGKAYFPDFRVKNKIIEVTEWRHPSKIKLFKLKKKIRDYGKQGFDSVLFIPEKIRKFYKGDNLSVISSLSELKKFLLPQ